MNWIRTGKPDDVDMADEFKKIDSMLPRKKGQTPLDRAKEIESALDWCRNKNVLPSDEPNVPGFEKMPSIPVSKRSPEDRKQDTDDILNWLRKGKPSELDTPNDEFAKIDQLLPQKKGQSPKDRAKEIESALDWIRQHNVSPDDESFPDNFRKLDSMPFSKRSPEERLKETDAILSWIRSGKPEAINGPTQLFQKFDQLLPQKKGQSPQDRAKDIESALDWTRNSGVPPADDFGTPADFEKIPSIPVSKRSPEDRKKDLNNILNWLRAGKPNDTDMADEFKKIDQMLPKKKGQSPQR